jgi:hypothetical protein
VRSGGCGVKEPELVTATQEELDVEVHEIRWE